MIYSKYLLSKSPSLAYPLLSQNPRNVSSSDNSILVTHFMYLYPQLLSAANIKGNPLFCGNTISFPLYANKISLFKI